MGLYYRHKDVGIMGMGHGSIPRKFQPDPPRTVHAQEPWTMSASRLGLDLHAAGGAR